MKNWKKLNSKQMSQIKGGGFWITIWSLAITSLVVGRSLFSEKASIAMNGVGRVSWDDDLPKNNDKSDFLTKNNQKQDYLENFVNKFYAI